MSSSTPDLSQPFNWIMMNCGTVLIPREGGVVFTTWNVDGTPKNEQDLNLLHNHICEIWPDRAKISEGQVPHPIIERIDGNQPTMCAHYPANDPKVQMLLQHCPAAFQYREQKVEGVDRISWFNASNLNLTQAIMLPRANFIRQREKGFDHEATIPLAGLDFTARFYLQKRLRALSEKWGVANNSTGIQVHTDQIILTTSNFRGDTLKRKINRIKENANPYLHPQADPFYLSSPA